MAFLSSKYFHANKSKKLNDIQRNLKKHLERKLLPETKAMKLPLRTSYFAHMKEEASIMFGACLSETVIWTFLMKCFAAPELTEYIFRETCKNHHSEISHVFRITIVHSYLWQYLSLILAWNMFSWETKWRFVNNSYIESSINSCYVSRVQCKQRTCNKTKQNEYGYMIRFNCYSKK